MTPAAVTDLLAAFAVRYGKRWREASEGISPDAQILAWHEDLEGIPDDIGQEAAARVRRSLPHPPTPADICQAAEGLGWGKTHQYWHRVNTIYSRRDLPWQTRSRRIRAMMGVLGPVVHLGYPDDPPFPQDIQGWAETEGKLWENAEERAAREHSVERQPAKQPFSEHHASDARDHDADCRDVGLASHLGRRDDREGGTDRAHGEAALDGLG